LPRLLQHNAGHTKSIRYYPTRLSVEELQVLTAKSLVSTATPGDDCEGLVLKNRLPSASITIAGTQLMMCAGFELPLGAYPVSEIRLDFPKYFLSSYI